MNQIKRILLSAVATLGVFSAVLVSCNPDACKNVVCNNGGSCLDGACQCPSGFEGTNCETLSRAKFLNAAGYQVIEDGTSSTAGNYTITMAQASTDSVSLYISNVWNSFANATKATVSGNTITIARQAPDADGYYVEGSGTYNNGIITMKYKVTDETALPVILTDDFGTVAGTPSLWTKK
jgi:hypothetical protein